MTVEVLDSADTVVAVSDPVVGDRPSARVQWNSGHVTDFAGQTVSLRFTLQEASLYSFWTASEVPEPSTKLVWQKTGVGDWNEPANWAGVDAPPDTASETAVFGSR